MTSPVNSAPDWPSYSATGNPDDILRSTRVAAQFGVKIDSQDGQADGLALTNGSAVGTDASEAVAMAANASMARTHAERTSALPQPHDYLASGQSVSDLVSGKIDIGPIVNLMISKGVKTIHFPCGTYRVATTINLINNVSLSGDGFGTIFSIQMTSGSVVSGVAVSYVRIHDLCFQADVTRTSGEAIFLQDSFENRFWNIIFSNGSGRHWHNIHIAGSNGTHIVRVAGRGGGGDGIWVEGSSKYSQDTYISESGFDGYDSAPLHVSWSSGLYISAMDLLGGKVAGVLLDPDSSKSQEVDGFRGTAVLADSNKGPGWLLGGTGPITEFNITNCWGSTNGYTPGTLNVAGIAAGFVVTNPASNNVVVSSCEFHANTGTGIDFENGTHLSAIGNMVFMNSAGKSGGYPGINVGSNPNFVIIANNMSGAGGEAQNYQSGISQSAQNYGILSSLPTGDTGHYAIFTGNLATGNQTGGFSIPTSTSDPNIVAANNVGF